MPRLVRSFLSLSLLLAACADDEGSAPSISDLLMSTTEMTVGQQNSLGGSLGFEDADADVVQLHAELALPDDEAQPVADVDLAGAADRTDGRLAFSLVLLPPASGDYAFALWLSD